MIILAVGSHPDDIELGCGGLILQAVRNGHDVYMYTLTRGEASGEPYSRINEEAQSARVIGARKLLIDSFQDTHLAVNSDLINHIERVIEMTQADLVLTHSLSDTHHDHRAAAAATVEAGRFAHNILSYEIPLSRDFKPQVFHDISDVIEKKISLISLFQSQKDKVYLTSTAIMGLSAYRALQSRMNSTKENKEIESVNHVEAFEVMKISLDNSMKLANTTTIERDHEPVSNPLTDDIQEILPSLEIVDSTPDQTRIFKQY